MSVLTVPGPTAIFSRNTPAYKQDGSQVAAGVPRYEAGEYGQAIMIEEGTTNLVAGANAEAGAFTTFVVTVTHPVTGLQVKAIKFPAGTVTPVTYSNFLNLAINTSYTVSFEAWTSGGSTAIAMDLYPDTLPQTTKTITGTAQRFTWTTSSSHADMGNCRLRFFDDIAPNPNTNDVYITNIQLEAKPYATSFANGTRNAETLTIPTAGVMNATEGAIACWVNPLDLQSSGAITKHIFDARSAGFDNTNTNMFRAHFPSGTALIAVSYGTGSSNNTITSSVALTANTLAHVAVVWSPAGVTLYINGVSRATTATPMNVTVSPLMSIGCDGTATGRQLNGLIDDLRPFTRALSDSEIAAIYGGAA